MKTIGLTGGIGSGKSTVLAIFKALSIPVYKADERSKLLLNNNDLLKSKLEHEFGEIYKDGKIDKVLFASIIFSNEQKRALANSIIHPFVREDFKSWLEVQNSPYVIQEAAILFETGAYKLFDFTILITAPEELRIKRIHLRDKSETEEIKKRMESQWKDEAKIPLSDFQILNDEKHSLIKQVLAIDSALRKQIKSDK